MKAITWDGSKITKPGIYSGIPLEVYHSADICDGPSVSSSGLRKIFNESPAHFFCEWPGNPQRIDKKSSRALIIGSAAHHLFLGQAHFDAIFIEQPGEYENEKGEIKPWNNNAKECRRWQADRKTEGKTVLTGAEIEDIKGMAIELGKHPIVRAGALNGAVERSIFWKDKLTGIWIKTRPDAIPRDAGDFVDYKKTHSVQWTDMMRSIGDYGYQMQGALIMDAARIVLGIQSPTFTLVFQESAPPYSVRVVHIKDEDIVRGAKQNRAAIDTFARCLKSGEWPGPGGYREDVEFIELSDYEHRRIDDALGRGE